MLFLYRIIKFSFQDIVRNFWLTMATIMILLLALFSINTLVVVHLISNNAVSVVKSKININLYLQSSASTDQIMALKTKISGLDNVNKVDYISKQSALDSFRAKYKNNPEVLTALQELGRNPLSPSLIVSPKNFSESNLVINELKTITNPIIESRDFTNNKIILDRINNITKRVNEVGLFIISIFILISLLVVYNTIRVAIYTHRQDIEIMRLVGASSYFIYLPYLFSALIYSLVSVLVTVAVVYPFLTLLQPYLVAFFNGYQVSILSYYLNNFYLVFGVQFLGVLAISSLASLLAVHKYTKI